MKKPIYDYILAELLTPEISDPNFEEKVGKFGKRFLKYHDSGFAISLPDNPMGNLRLTVTEVMEYLELPGDQVIIHLNTFHKKHDLDEMIETALKLGVANLLCVSGDGNRKLHRLEPKELGLEPTPMGGATSVELLKYINREYPGKFSCGVAFNPYEEHDLEFWKLDRKMEAKAEFIITQLYLSSGLVEEFEHKSSLTRLSQYKKPVAIGIWTPSNTAGDNSEKAVQKIDLFLECISPYYSENVITSLRDKLIKEGYDAFAVLKSVKENYARLYPSFSVYFSLPNLNRLKEWKLAL